MAETKVETEEPKQLSIPLEEKPADTSLTDTPSEEQDTSTANGAGAPAPLPSDPRTLEPPTSETKVEIEDPKQLPIPRKEKPADASLMDTPSEEQDTSTANGTGAPAPSPSDPRTTEPLTPETEMEIEEPKQRPIPRKGKPADASLTDSPSSVKPQNAGTSNGAAPASDPRTAASPAPAAPSRPGSVPGPTYGLPEGVTVPPSVDSSLLQGRLLDTLMELPVDLINDALAEYDDAVNNKGGSIRNQGAYLYGVIKRYKSVTERAASGEGDGVMGKTVTPVVLERLEKLVQDGFCTQEEMNDKVKSKIRMLSEKDALFAIDELSSVQRGQIHNFSSYFMGILNRYMRGDKVSKAREDRSINQYSSSRGRHYNSQGRNDRRTDDRYSRGRSPDRDYRRRDDDHRGRSSYGDRDNHSHRERSRDRYDDDRRRGDYRRTDSLNSYRDRSRYDPRQPPPQQPQQLPPQQLPPQQYSQQGQYGGYGSFPPPPPPRQGMSSMNAYAPPPQQQQQPPPQQQQHPQMYMPPNQSFQQSPPQQYVPQQGALTLGLPSGSSFVPQQQTMGGQQLPFTGQQVAYMSNMQQSPPNMGNQQSPPIMGNQQSPPIMGNQQSPPIMGNQQPPSPMGHQQQQPFGLSNVSYGAPAPGNLQAPQGIPDIFGLADKAASAVQALQASRAMSTPVVNTPAPQMQMHNTSLSLSYPALSSSQPPQARRGRTTASLNELPVMVQYAVQNLQATGHVDGALDEGILGMIKELPEDVALQSLDRFSSIDTNIMKNKTAYLAGVLRRELESVRRR